MSVYVRGHYYQPDMVAGASPINLPNAITVTRILLAPVLVIVLLNDTGGGSMIAAAVFAAGALGDVVDGTLARARGLVTDVGKLLDPVADKLLVGAALVALVLVDRLALWVPAVILAREVLVTGLRTAAARRGQIIDASFLGKLKMTLQIAMVLVLCAAREPGLLWIDVLVGATVAATVVSGLAVVLRFARGSMPREQPGEEAPPGRA
ncbi:MAG TPA: CDP-diacylglycerol--glycerol-3-phosphate 3-phosphatidyltransferase [Solirubrobacteraceae bacterium]|nr:CDP-diacylglycerol--glycerol-3-phosphate 3-phosphatidyltransferase [Solirubrobacteraceae bacterium]